MALGPMEIHQKEFNTVRMGGYNKEEVDAFLDQVADEMDRLIHRSQELMGMVENMRSKVTEYDSMQQTLQNALINAQRSADGTLQEAQSQADTLLEEARSQAASLMEEAGRSKEAAVQEAGVERDRLAAELDQLRAAADDYIASVRGMLDSTARTLDDYESRLAQARESAAAAAVPTAMPVEPVMEFEAAPETVEEAPLYVPPAPEPAYQETVPESAYQETIPEPAYPETVPEAPPAYQETMPEPAFQEPQAFAPEAPPAYQETMPEPAFQEPQAFAPEAPPAYQETVPEPGLQEPQAFVPSMEPMEEVPEEESPIRPLEAGSDRAPGLRPHHAPGRTGRRGGGHAPPGPVLPAAGRRAPLHPGGHGGQWKPGIFPGDLPGEPGRGGAAVRPAPGEGRAGRKGREALLLGIGTPRHPNLIAPNTC